MSLIQIGLFRERKNNLKPMPSLQMEKVPWLVGTKATPESRFRFAGIFKRVNAQKTLRPRKKHHFQRPINGVGTGVVRKPIFPLKRKSLFLFSPRALSAHKRKHTYKRESCWETLWCCVCIFQFFTPLRDLLPFTHARGFAENAWNREMEPFSDCWIGCVWILPYPSFWTGNLPWKIWVASMEFFVFRCRLIRWNKFN